MFKKAYKDINDSIPVNEELLKSLLDEAKKPVKVVRFKNIYKYGAVAAALILAVSATAIPNFMEDKPESKSAKSNIASTSSVPAETKAADKPEIKVSEAPILAYDNQTAQEKTIQKELPETKEVQASTKVIRNQSKPALKSEGEVQDALAQPEQDYQNQPRAEADKPIKESVNKPLKADTENPTFATANEKAAVARSIGGDYSAKNDADNIEEVNVDEYLKSFGFNLANPTLPSDVKRLNDTTWTLRDENGNFIFSDCVLSFSGNDNREVTIIVSRNQDYALEMINLNPSGIAVGENGYIGAYVLSNNGAYIVDCYNLSVNEVETLVSSLK